MFAFASECKFESQIESSLCLSCVRCFPHSLILCLNLRYGHSYLWQLKPQEVTDIMKDFDEPGHLAPTGLHLGGAKYMVIQGEAGAVIRGKKVKYQTQLDPLIMLPYLDCFQQLFTSTICFPKTGNIK